MKKKAMIVADLEHKLRLHGFRFGRARSNEE